MTLHDADHRPPLKYHFLTSDIRQHPFEAVLVRGKSPRELPLLHEAWISSLLTVAPQPMQSTASSAIFIPQFLQRMIQSPISVQVSKIGSQKLPKFLHPDLQPSDEGYLWHCPQTFRKAISWRHCSEPYTAFYEFLHASKAESGVNEIYIRQDN